MGLLEGSGCCGALNEIVDGGVAVQTEFEREGGGLLELLGAKVLDQTQNPERFANDLPGMTLARQLSLEDLACGGADPLGTGQQIVDAELTIGPVLWRPVRLDGQALVAAGCPRMGGDEGATLEDFHGLGPRRTSTRWRIRV